MFVNKLGVKCYTKREGVFDRKRQRIIEGFEGGNSRGRERCQEEGDKETVKM